MVTQKYQFSQELLEKVEAAFEAEELRAEFGARTIKISMEDQSSLHMWKVSWQIFIQEGTMSMNHVSVNGKLTELPFEVMQRLEDIGNRVAVREKLSW